MINKTSIAAALFGAAMLVNAGSASAIVGATDNVPAATLFLPYFEIDTQNPGGIRTVVTVGNRSTSEQLAHVTLWTDRGVPTYTFDVRLPGQDRFSTYDGASSYLRCSCWLAPAFTHGDRARSVLR